MLYLTAYLFVFSEILLHTLTVCSLIDHTL